MKSTIFYLGLIALSFNNVATANELKQQNFENSLQQNAITTLNVQNSLNNGGVELTDTTIFDPSTVIKTSNENKIEEVIAQDKLITQAQEEVYQPIILEKTIEDNIVEYNQIIEGNDLNEVYPLDFEKINSEIQNSKVTINKATIIIDLKL